MKKILWEEMHRTEIGQAAEAGAIVIIPVASIEQHANHLPTNTDTNACSTVAKRAAEMIGTFKVLVMPPIWMGYSPHHMAYPGSITLTYKTFVNVLTEVAVSVSIHGFEKILFLNGHGGNSAIVSSMRTKMKAEKNVSVIAYDYWHLPGVTREMKSISETDKGCIGHAGEMETSLQLFLQPDLVEMNLAEWAPGTMGDPSSGNCEKGERFFNAVVSALIDTLKNFHNGTLEDKLVWRKKIPDDFKY